MRKYSPEPTSSGIPAYPPCRTVEAIAAEFDSEGGNTPGATGTGGHA
jgi:hypothetical protein